MHDRYLRFCSYFGPRFGYPKYLEYKKFEKIKTSKTGQAIESFLNIVDKTPGELNKPPKPLPTPPKPDDDTILKPFDEVTKLAEED